MASVTQLYITVTGSISLPSNSMLGLPLSLHRLSLYWCSKLDPYNTIHSVQLQAFLENVYWNIQRENWTVDAAGVAGGIDVWKDADTEQRWYSYLVPLGPGRYW